MYPPRRFRRNRTLAAASNQVSGGTSLARQVLAGATGYIPLTHTVVPTRGNLTPSFTRATTETGQKHDPAGYLDFTALAGEVIFKGAMRIYNEWTTSSVSLASGGNKSLTLAAGTYQFSMGIGTGTATFSGTGGATGTLDANVLGRVGVAKTITAGTLVITASVADLADLQVCNITGETDQTTIRPYVSVGVLSSPFQGAFVDGVQYFPYDLNGNAIPRTGSYPLVGYVPWEARTNYALQSNAFTTTWGAVGAGAAVQNAVGANGYANHAWTLTDASAVAAEGRTQTGIAWGAGTSGCFSVLVQKKASNPEYPAIVSTVNTATTTYWFLIVNEVAGTVSAVAAAGSLVAPVTTGIVSYDDDYWLVWGSALQTGATTTATVWLYPSSSSNGTTIDVAAQGSTVFQDAQFEYGTGVTFPSPRIPTTTAAVTRNADILTYTGAEIANYKAMACTFSRGVGVSNIGVPVALSDGTLNNYEANVMNGATANKFDGLAGGGIQWSTAASNAYTPGGSSKVAWSAATNSIKMDKDGTAQTPDTVATVPAVTQIDVGHLAGSYVLNGPVTDLYFWTRNLSQSELGAVDR